jgi:hypothetical protein
MKPLVLSILLSLLFTLQVHAFNEPDNFMGIKFFTDLTKTVKKCREKVIGGQEFGPDSDQGICWLEGYTNDYVVIHNTHLFYGSSPCRVGTFHRISDRL